MYQIRRKQDIPYLFIGKLLVLLLFMIVLFMIAIFVFPEKSAAAGDTTVKSYTITTVEIEEGDSLWSIASEYYTEEFSSLSKYISEIKRMNKLSSDTLYAGNYILVPHYTR